MRTDTTDVSKALVRGRKAMWADWIVSIGYSPRQGRRFAAAYAAEILKLPLCCRNDALDSFDDRCLDAGFKAAGISVKKGRRRAFGRRGK
jgi:hypothetical protein